MKICVVGGGPAGLSMAYFLEANGYHDVFVFEREREIGGKCRTLRKDGRAYDMGAVEITPNYTIVNDLVAKFGCSTEKLPEGRVIDAATGATASTLSLWNDFEKVELVLQLAIFFEHELALQPYLHAAGFRNLPASLRGVSFKEWLHRIGAPLVERFFWMPLTCYGYGLLEDIPAAYALKFITAMELHLHAIRLGFTELLPERLRTEGAFVYRLTDGFQTLMERMAATFTHEPITGATIECVERTDPSGAVVVRYRVAGEDTVRSERFDKLVIAIPETLQNLSFLSPTAAEKGLFSEVFTGNYYTSFTKPRTFDYKLFFELRDSERGEDGPPPLPHVLQFLRSWEQARGSVFYSYSAKDDPRPLTGGGGSIEALVNDAIRAAGLVPGDAVQSFAWQYFPRVSQAALDDGFYDKLEAIQGSNSTFYAGGLLNFELVEKSMEYSKDLVDRFFPRA